MDYSNYLIIIFSISFAAMIGEYLFLYYPLLKKKEISTNGKNLPALSVIICAKNEAENLKKNLPAILSQQYPNFEVIVVNDNSTDATQEVLESFVVENKHLRIINQNENVGKKAALKYGISKAKNEFLVLTDADCIPASKFWLKHYGTAFSEDKKIVLGYGAYKEENTFLNRIIRYDTILIAMQYMGMSRKNFTYMGVGRNMGYHQSLVKLSGGLEKNTDLRSGDDDLFIQEAVKICPAHYLNHPESFTISEPKKTWSEFVNQKSRHLTTGFRYPLIIHIWLWLLMSRHIFTHIPILALYFLGEKQTALFLLINLYISLYLLNKPIFKEFKEKALDRYSGVFDLFYTLVTIYIVFRSIGFSKQRWN